MHIQTIYIHQTDEPSNLCLFASGCVKYVVNFVVQSLQGEFARGRTR